MRDLAPGARKPARVSIYTRDCQRDGRIPGRARSGSIGPHSGPRSHARSGTGSALWIPSPRGGTRPRPAARWELDGSRSRSRSTIQRGSKAGTGRGRDRLARARSLPDTAGRIGPSSGAPRCEIARPGPPRGDAPRRPAARRRPTRTPQRRRAADAHTTTPCGALRDPDTNALRRQSREPIGFGRLERFCRFDRHYYCYSPKEFRDRKEKKFSASNRSDLARDATAW